MKSICVKFYKGADVTEDDEEILVDYLSDRGVDVDIDTSTDDLCMMALTKHFGYKKRAERFVKGINQEKEIEMISEPIRNKYGDLDINTYLQIALAADDRTLLNMMNVSYAHRSKFDDNFFKNYMKLHYPHQLKYKLYGQTYRQYYLDTILSISKLKENFNFIYLPEHTYDIIQFLKDVERIQEYAPHLLQSYLNKRR